MFGIKLGLHFRCLWDIHEMLDSTNRQKLWQDVCIIRMAFLEPGMSVLIWFCWTVSATTAWGGTSCCWLIALYACFVYILIPPFVSFRLEHFAPESLGSATSHQFLTSPFQHLIGNHAYFCVASVDNPSGWAWQSQPFLRLVWWVQIPVVALTHLAFRALERTLSCLLTFSYILVIPFTQPVGLPLTCVHPPSVLTPSA